MEIPTGESGQALAKQSEEEPSAVTVNLQLEGGEEGEEVMRVSVKCALGASVGSVRERVCGEWGLEPGSTSLSFNGETLADSAVISELGVGPGQSVDLLVHYSQPTGGDAPTNQANPVKPADYRMPDVFTVQVGGGKEVLVRVERAGKKRKPFLGGYRHRETGVEYHNAAVQTAPPHRPHSEVERYDRDTQTVTTRNRYQQVSVDTATQMDETGHYIDDRRDRILTAGPYELADDYHTRILAKVILLQSYWRRWLSRRYVDALRRERRARQEWEREREEERRREREEREKREFQRRINPQTKEDFELLYHALEVWRKEELERINSTTSGAERKAALCSLLEKEAELIAGIGQHRTAAGTAACEKAVEKFLDATAAPKRWIAYDGNTTEMATPYTLRAGQLRDLYHSLASSSLTSDERLDVLLTLKCTVKEHDCELTRELVSLIDREADLLVRDLRPQAMAGLRKRIANLFFQYCRTPLFNPEAAKHIRVPQDPVSLRGNVYYCRSCCQYLPSTDFELSTNSRVVGHCRRCDTLDNEARSREDLTTYRGMLRHLRKTEEAQKDGSHVIFLVQECDIRYLVETIWRGQSALSGESDLPELRLVRWEAGQPWTPWNTVLLTQEEAQTHTRIQNVNESYGTQFVAKVYQKHVLAKTYFSRVVEMVESMRSKVADLPLPRPSEHVITARLTKISTTCSQQKAAVIQTS